MLNVFLAKNNIFDIISLNVVMAYLRFFFVSFFSGCRLANHFLGLLAPIIVLFVISSLPVSLAEE